MPENYPLELTVKVGGKRVKKWYDALAPYEVFSKLFNHPDYFKQCLLGNYCPEILSDWWRHMETTSWARDSSCPVFANMLEAARCTFPTVWHSDGGEIYNEQVYSVYHWSTPFTYDCDPKDAKLYCIMLEEAMMTPEAEAEITEFIGYNDKIMTEGVHPSTGFKLRPLDPARAALAGKPLAGGWKASFAAWTGDGKEETRVHHLTRNYNCNWICKKCLGCRHLSEGCAYDFREGAQWTLTLVTHRYHCFPNRQWQQLL